MKLKTSGFLDLVVLSALCLLFVPGESRATSFNPAGTTTTNITITIGTGESFQVNSGATLNQTGGVITVTGSWGNSYGIGLTGVGVYNMSQDASLIATNLSGGDTRAGSYRIVAGSRLTMTNTAVANIKYLDLYPTNGSLVAKAVLSGNASLTVYGFGNGQASYGFTIGSGSYIDFVSGSLATLTLTGTHNFTNLVNAGSIRVDGAQAYMGSFQVTGNTLSLKPAFPGLDHFEITINSSLPLTAGTPASFTITAKDGSGSTLTAFTNTVDFAGTAGITGTSAEFAAGVLSGVNLTPVTAGSNVTLIVVGGGKVSTSSTFAVDPNAASKLSFGQQPVTTMPGAVISPAVTVLVQDAYGNTVTGDNSTEVTISGPDMSGTLVVTASSGVATFSNLKPMTLTNGITLAASSSPALTPATSTSFIVGPVTIYGNYTPSGTTTIGYGTNYTINANGGDFLVNSGATLNQTGCVITVTVGWGHFGVGTSGTGVFNMSGYASLIATNLSGGDSGNGTFHIGAGSRLTMTSNAVANIKYLNLKPASGALVAKVVLSGNASLTVYGFSDGFSSTVIGAGSYIDFVSGSLATFTMTGTHNFTNLVTNGFIRVDGAAENTFDKFSVTNNTLSLRAPRPTGLVVSKGPAGGVYVEWAASATANGYLVYRSTNDDGTGYGLIGGTSGQTATNFTDSTAKYLINYYYEVSGTNSTGESVKSAPSSAIMLSNPGSMISIY